METGIGDRAMYLALLAGLWLATALPAAGQLCAPSVAGSNAPQMAVRVGGVGKEPVGGVGFVFNPASRVLVGAEMSFGGFDTGAEVPKALGVRIAGRFAVGAVSLCPAAQWTGARYDYVERFESDRGEVAEASAIVLLEASSRMGTVAGFEWGWRLTPSLVNRWRTVGLRTVTLGPGPLGVESQTDEERNVFAEGELAVTALRGDFGLAGGVESRRWFERTRSYFVQVIWTLSGS